MNAELGRGRGMDASTAKDKEQSKADVLKAAREARQKALAASTQAEATVRKIKGESEAPVAESPSTVQPLDTYLPKTETAQAETATEDGVLLDAVEPISQSPIDIEPPMGVVAGADTIVSLTPEQVTESPAAKRSRQKATREKNRLKAEADREERDRIAQEIIESNKEPEVVSRESGILREARERVTAVASRWSNAMGRATQGIARSAGELFRRTKAEAPKEVLERFPAPTFASEAWKAVKEVWKGDQETMGLGEGKGIIGETFSRSHEIAKLASYLWNDFGGETYREVRDTLSGEKERRTQRAVEAATGDKQAPDLSDVPAEGEKMSDQDLEQLAAVNALAKDWFVSGEPEEDDETRRGEQEKVAREHLDKYVLGRALNRAEDLTAGAHELATFTAEGAIDLGRGYGKMFEMMADEYRGFVERLAEAEAKGSKVMEHGIEPAWILQKEIAQEGVGRIEQAKRESDENATEAQQAQTELVMSIAEARERFEAVIAQKEQEKREELEKTNKELAKSHADELEQFDAAVAASSRLATVKVELATPGVYVDKGELMSEESINEEIEKHEKTLKGLRKPLAQLRKEFAGATGERREALGKQIDTLNDRVKGLEQRLNTLDAAQERLQDSKPKTRTAAA